MNDTAQLENVFKQARKLHSEGRLAEAEQAYRQLLTPGEHRIAILEILADLYLQDGRPVEAADTLVALREELPDNLLCCARLASLLDGMGQTEAAIGHYQRLLERQPKLAAAHFNVALLYKKIKQYGEALSAYESAVQLGIDDIHEVYSNIGVLYSELHLPDKAREMYERAIDADPNYVSSLFNLAALCEEQGDYQEATTLYKRILSVDSQHWESLARLAYAGKITNPDDELIKRIKRSIDSADPDPISQEGLYFALGKMLDDVGEYDEAFAAYEAANTLGRQRNPPYDREVTEQAFDQLISLFDSDWISSAKTDSVATPIFICGMFRSGSTLVEQIVAAHPSITAGGELDILSWLIGRKLAPYPHGVKNAPKEKLASIGVEYLSKVQELFPGHENLTDKRPDNFLHLGLIKAVFPAAKIIFTKRNLADNCLSIFFQQLGGSLTYTTDLDDIAHYRLQHDRLMDHWIACFGKDIFTVDYDDLVHSPEPVLRELVSYLGFAWDESFLAFEKANSLVKTASVWQVRQELHSLSSGRWRNYEPYIGKSKLVLPPLN